MRFNLKSITVLLLLYNVSVETVSGQQLATVADSNGARAKRAFDLGLVLRNILLKSSQASNAKAAVKNVKLPRTTTTTTTTTTPRPTLPPLFMFQKPFLFPFDFSASSGAIKPVNTNFNSIQGNVGGAAAPGGTRGGARGGFINFDYDYVAGPMRRRRPTTTTTTAAPSTTSRTTPSVATPMPPLRALRPIGRPIGGNGRRPQFFNYDYYNDYDYPTIVQPSAPGGTPTPTAPAGRTSRPNQRRPPAQNVAATVTPQLPAAGNPTPIPPANGRSRSRQRRPPAQNATAGGAAAMMAPQRPGATQMRPLRLRFPLISQYAQPNDISINNRGNVGQSAGNANPQTVNTNGNANANANAITNSNTNSNANANSNANSNDDLNDIDDAMDYDDINANANANYDDINANYNDDINANVSTSPQNANEQNNQNVNSNDYDADANVAIDPFPLDDYNDSSDNANTNANNDSPNSDSNGNGLTNNVVTTNTQPNNANALNNNNAPIINPSPFNNFVNNPNGFPTSPPFNPFIADFPNGQEQGQAERQRQGQGQGQAQGQTGAAPSIQATGTLPAGFQNFQFSTFNGYNAPYQQPSAPIGYSVRYY